MSYEVALKIAVVPVLMLGACMGEPVTKSTEVSSRVSAEERARLTAQAEEYQREADAFAATPAGLELARQEKEENRPTRESRALMKDVRALLAQSDAFLESERAWREESRPGCRERETVLQAEIAELHERAKALTPPSLAMMAINVTGPLRLCFKCASFGRKECETARHFLGTLDETWSGFPESDDVSQPPRNPQDITLK